MNEVHQIKHGELKRFRSPHDTLCHSNKYYVAASNVLCTFLSTSESILSLCCVIGL